MFELLANRRRRFALYILTDRSGDGIALETLIDEVATLTAAVDGDAVTAERHLPIARDLYQWHLPVLADVGVIDCDARHNTIRYLDHPTLDTWVTRAKQDELP